MIEMRILMVGRENPYTAEFFYKKAFSALGNEVCLINSYKGIDYPLMSRVIHTRTNFFNFTLKRLWINKHLKAYIDKLDPDCIIFFKGEMISTEILSELSNNRSIYLFYPDTYKFPVLLRERLTYFAAIFTASNNKVPYYKMGARKVVTVPWACDPDFHKKMEIEKKYDISFIGTAYRERRKIIRNIGEIEVFGDFWYGFSSHSHASVYGEDFVKTINESRVNLNLQARISVQADAPTMRTFELAGCGGFQISDYMNSLKRYFPDIVTFKTLDELGELITYYLDNAYERDKIANRTREQCLSNFKYSDSASKILLNI